MQSQNGTRLYVSDLDGTLLDEGGRLSPFARRELTRLLQEGLPFTVASARSVHSMRELLEGLPLSLPVIELNGSCLTELQTRRHLHIQSICPDVAAPLYECYRAYDLHPFLSGYDGATDFLAQSGELHPGMDWYVEERRRVRDPRLLELRKPEAVLDQQIISMTGIGDRPVMEALHADLSERFGDAIAMDLFENRYSPGWFWLSTHDGQATKGHALEVLLEMLELPPAALTVFGDQRNDLGLFRVAGHCVAVENACPELLDRADRRIGPHTDDAVVRYLMQCHPGERPSAR